MLSAIAFCHNGPTYGDLIMRSSPKLTIAVLMLGSTIAASAFAANAPSTGCIPGGQLAQGEGGPKSGGQLAQGEVATPCN